MARPQRVLISGIAGFIGSALARRLAASGVQVFGLVRPSTRRDRLDDLSNIELLELTDQEPQTLERALVQARPDVVFNLAAAGVAPGENNSQALFQGNVELIVHLMQAMAQAGPARLIHAGSCFEYGPAAADEPLAETAPLQPFSFYGATKSAASLLALALAPQLGIDLMVLRLFGVYGPGEAPYRFVPFVIERLLRGEPVELTTGEQVRDVLFIDDVVDAFWKAACCSRDPLHPAVFNVCSGTPLSIRELGQTIAQLLQRPEALLRWGTRPSRTREPARIVGNHQRFADATGWLPQTSLRAGLRQTIDCLLARENSLKSPAA